MFIYRFISDKYNYLDLEHGNKFLDESIDQEEPMEVAHQRSLLICEKQEIFSQDSLTDSLLVA